MPSVNGGPAATKTPNLSAVMGDLTSELVYNADNSLVSALPNTEAADRPLTSADANRILVCAANRTFTVNSGMPAFFGPAAVGAGVVTFTAGSGVAITDNRTTGATNPSCCLMPVGTDTYYVVGSKA